MWGRTQNHRSAFFFCCCCFSFFLLCVALTTHNRILCYDITTLKPMWGECLEREGQGWNMGLPNTATAAVAAFL